ncbi:S66 peptidase family protein [Ectobacillus ponti]|uniref:LD-carboxypeptidase n=1 Tax=Ectobacillus ponti TaxID=2961894 RepID=A0AA41X423_9BACI|nr:LD-carboxypeptidase [Ectobacillus ponti]MCP8968556.1 LD-carboxypeptidase [Ectobacillus ponti]
MQRPSCLQPGDTVMIVAPSSPADFDKVLLMKQKLEAMGLRVLLGDSAARQRGYLAGTDAARADDLHLAFSHPAVKAVFCARGGYGSARLLSLLDFPLIRRNPKIFWGYSDVTALHLAFGRHAGLVTFHGPMMEECGGGGVDAMTLSSFEQLFTPQFIMLAAQDEYIYPSFSSVTAPLTGGNLTVLASTLGTPYEVDTGGKILFLEDIGEEPYRLDRMLNQLKLAGKLQQCAGLILGSFSDCAPKRQSSLSLPEIIYDHVVPYGIPILSGFPLGHCRPHQGIPFGVPVTMNGEDQTLVFEPGVK